MWNLSDNTPINSAGIGPDQITSYTDQGSWGDPTLNMATKSRASVGHRCHQIPQGLCLVRLPITWAWTDAKDESGSREWRLKVQLPCFQLSLFFWTPKSTLFRVFKGLDIIRPRGPKIQAMPVLSPLYGLVQKILRKIWLLHIRFSQKV